MSIANVLKEVAATLSRLLIVMSVVFVSLEAGAGVVIVRLAAILAFLVAGTGHAMRSSPQPTTMPYFAEAASSHSQKLAAKLRGTAIS
jgi:hypothetical protein